jgi:predicted transcriptional regulator
MTLAVHRADTVGAAAEKTREAGQDQCIVVNGSQIVLGRLRSAALKGNPDAKVGDVMELGPTTSRPDAEVAPILERMLARNVDRILVATSGGRLIGTMWRDDAERRAGEPDDEIACDC